MTPRKQLIKYAISIIKEVAKSPKDIKVEYTNNIIWVVFDNGSDDGFMYLSKYETIKRNRLKYLEIIKRIRA
jgi:hypothetical protein